MGRDDRRRLLRDSLEGLSVGDALGQASFGASTAERRRRTVPPPRWRWTDDTAMAVSVGTVLWERGAIDQDELAADFARRYSPDRGYGPGMQRLLPLLSRGISWREGARALYGGEGSFGNGAAMRVAPLGAYFAGDPDRAAAEAALSAEVTHAHPEGMAGAQAVAIAACLWAGSRGGPAPDPFGVITQVLGGGGVAAMVERAAGVGDVPVDEAVNALGNGSLITAEDTVGLCLWVAGRHPDDYPAALWDTLDAGGDLDTTCAIVGGIVAARTGTDGIPGDWLGAREPLPRWPGGG